MIIKNIAFSSNYPVRKNNTAQNLSFGSKTKQKKFSPDEYMSNEKSFSNDEIREFMNKSIKIFNNLDIENIKEINKFILRGNILDYYFKKSKEEELDGLINKINENVKLRKKEIKVIKIVLLNAREKISQLPKEQKNKWEEKLTNIADNPLYGLVVTAYGLVGKTSDEIAAKCVLDILDEIN